MSTLLTNLRGPAGYNATGAAQDDAAIAQKIRSEVGMTDTRKAINENFVSRRLPDGLTGTGRYDAATGIYGFDRVPRFAMRALDQAATAHKKILCVGHSLVGGAGANGASFSWPSRLRNYLTRTISQNTGIVFATQASTMADEQWTIGAGWNRFSTDNMTMFLNSAAAGSLATFQSTRAGTIVEIWTTGQSAAFEYRIDSGSWVTYTPTGTFAVQAVRLTGLTNIAHKVEIRSLTASNTHLVGVEVRNATGLSITNMGAAGSLSGQWVNPTWYTIGPMSQQLGPWDLTFIQVSTNDMRNDVPIGTYMTNLHTMINRYMPSMVGEVILCVDPQPNPVAQGGYNAIPPGRALAYRQAAYDIADIYSLRVFDSNGFFGTYDQANADGMMFDSVHMTDAGYQRFARAIDRIMAP